MTIIHLVTNHTQSSQYIKDPVQVSLYNTDTYIYVFPLDIV